MYGIRVGLLEKLSILADAAKYDASCASSGSKRKNIGGLGNTEGMGICHSYAPDGRCISLLKVLFTNHCLYDCMYCVNRVSSDVKRAQFTVEEVVSLTLEFYRRNYIEGLFLSSGVLGSADATMEKMVSVAQILREKHLFGGYIHLKAVAGASPEISRSAGLWADRVSVNIELPRPVDLLKLAPAKTHEETESTMQVLKDGIDASKEQKEATPGGKKFGEIFAPAGQSTQIIVGATEASDAHILTKAVSLYRNFRLKRVYYTAYSPIPHSNSGLPHHPPPLLREHRLYQADWLVRHYGYDVGELASDKYPDLDLSRDPKLSWALRNRFLFPVNINRAFRQDLLRVPGLGVRTVDRILNARRFRKLTLEDLTRMGASIKKAKFFIQVKDVNPYLKFVDSVGLEGQLKPEPVQLSLFETGASARTGEL